MIRLALILPLTWALATACAVTLDSAGGKLAHAQIHPTSCGAC
jgi:hypothetical protein